MSHSTPATAAHSTLIAKPDQRQALWDYLAGIKTAADNGKNLHQWYAYKIDDEPDSESFEFGVFSVFADTSARDEYLDGTIPRALESKASQLLTRSPSLNTVNIIASKVSQRDDKLNTTVHATLVAKPDSATQLKSLLSGSYAAAIQEETTTQYWYAYQKDETTFGLFGAFSSHSGLGQHLSGPAVATMAEAAAPLLAQPLQPKKGKIISKKV